MERELIIKYWCYKEGLELPHGDKVLLEKAKEAAKKAYAPYSKFSVGAAVKLDNGEYITGSNQENAAFPSGLCAERVVLFYAQSQFPTATIETLAIVAYQEEKMVAQPLYPCGACRQVMVESEQRGASPMRVICGGAERVEVVEGVASLLPFLFHSIPEK